MTDVSKDSDKHIRQPNRIWSSRQRRANRTGDSNVTYTRSLRFRNRSHAIQDTWRKFDNGLSIHNGVKYSPMSVHAGDTQADALDDPEVCSWHFHLH